MEKLKEKKVVKEINSMLDELGEGLASNWMTGMGATVQELTLPNGRMAQIKVSVTCDRDDFEEVCPD